MDSGKLQIEQVKKYLLNLMDEKEKSSFGKLIEDVPSLRTLVDKYRDRFVALGRLQNSQKGMDMKRTFKRFEEDLEDLAEEDLKDFGANSSNDTPFQNPSAK